jgi:hypothetical protein
VAIYCIPRTMTLFPKQTIPLAVSFATFATVSAGVDFNRDIRPILSDKCFHCHGQDAKNQKSDFRVDTREHALADLGGYAGVVPGNLEASELHHRIHATDGDRMPPADSNRSLSENEKALLDTWIREGAEYDVHWAFKKPVRKDLPQPPKEFRDWVRNPIDNIVLARLLQEGLEPSPEASTETLKRRASLTLTGTNPDLDALDGKAYEDAVEGFLASMDFAERQALRWLDAARYADTDGYQTDAERKNWPWRDWVIKAFHDNMPFDQFTIEQLAGDMIPDASDSQVLASAFNRNHRQNAEGGALAPEFYVENVIDRLETTSTVWLGLTLGCARCHDHKYDPITQYEFYQLFGYFNNIGERGTGKGVSANPVMQVPSPLVKVPEGLATALEAAKAAEAEAKEGFRKRLDQWVAEQFADQPDGPAQWSAAAQGAASAKGGQGKLEADPEGGWIYQGSANSVEYELEIPAGGQTVAGIRLDTLTHPDFSKPRQLSRSVNGNFVLSEFEVEAGGQTIPVSAASATYEQDKYPIKNALDGNPSTGWAVYPQSNPQPEDVSATFALSRPVTLVEGQALKVRLRHLSNYGNHNIGRFRLYFSEKTPALDVSGSVSPEVQTALQTPSGERTPAQKKALAKHFQGIDLIQQVATKKREAIEKKIAASGAGPVPVMVMREKSGDPMPAYFLDRGQYDAPDTSKPLPRAIPAAFFKGKPDDQPKDRLGFASWLVSKDNPLTARVTVNRIWQEHFGLGLVKTPEDFGTQGDVPIYDDLLDWLAVEFMESGWDVKGLHRLIVNSATYRQKSKITDTLYKQDPANRLLARGPRFRLDGFVIRDNALEASGLLDGRVGGPPVKPYQPVGLWNSVSSGPGTRYNPGKGGDLYRKSMYTYWKRAVNPPRQLIFDAGGREACNVGVKRTNTPLQALVLMNDVTFLDVARNLAEKVLKTEGLDSDTRRLIQIYNLATATRPEDKALAILSENLAWFREHFAKDTDGAAKFLRAGESPRDESIPAEKLAPWAAVAHLVLNMDTTISVQ